MWKYNNTQDMYCPESYHNPDELYHYGVLGMRWHNRKFNRAENNRQRNLVKIRSKLAGVRKGSNKYARLKSKEQEIKTSRYGSTNAKIAGKALLAGALATYGSYKLAKMAHDKTWTKTLTGQPVSEAKKFAAGLGTAAMVYGMYRMGKGAYQVGRNQDGKFKKVSAKKKKR